MARRRGGESPLSLFAFQDIITGVAGVMLFILMLLVVQLALPKVQQAASKTASEDSSIPSKPVATRQSIDRLAELKEELEQLRQRSKTLRDIVATNPQQTLADRKSELDELQQRTESIEQQLKSERERLDSKQSDQIAKQIAQQIERAEQSLQWTQKELEQWSEGDIVAFRPAADSTAMWTADVRGDSAEIFDLSNPRSIQKITFSPDADADQIASAITRAVQRKTSDRRLVLVVRPAIAEKVAPLIEALRKQNYDVALELLDSPTRIVASSD